MPIAVAVVVKGKIGGMTQTYRDSNPEICFSLVLPESTFRNGYNHVGIYLVSPTADYLEMVETNA